MKKFELGKKKLDPTKYGFDYGMGGPIVLNSSKFRICSFCNGKGEINGNKCINCDGTGATERHTLKT